MALTQQHSTQNAGRGLFSNQGIAAGHEILRTDRPLLAALDSARLKDGCANCFFWSPNDAASNDNRLVTAHGEQTDHQLTFLKGCLGCKVVSYCSKDCQTNDWKKGHKHECKVYTSLHPNVLPNTIRLLLRLLLRYKHSNLPPETWRSFTALESHTTSFKSSKTKNSDNLTTWQTITLMSQAILKYSSLDISPESMQSHLARVMINTHTLTTDTLDPLGLCLEPKTAMLNHSCTPNSYLIFSGPTLSLRSLVDIPKGTELTIAYVDTTNPTLKRQAELQERYFFTCNCHGCSKKLTNNAPDPRLEDPRIQRLWADVTELQSGAASLPPLEAVEKLRSALKILKKEDYLPSQQPFAAVLHSFFLNAVACQDWLRALKCAVNAARQVEPVQYPVEHHPVRVVRKWVLLKLVVQIVGLMLEGEESVKGILEGAVGTRLDLRTVALGLWKEVEGLVGRSHGKESRFAEDVRVFGVETEMVGQVWDKGAYERGWETLGKIVEKMKW